MAKPTNSKVASMLPDEMSAGLADDFRGKVTAATFCKFDYDGNIPEPVLAARLTIQPHDESAEPIIQHWSAGNLNAFSPSEDGEEEAEEGPYALRVGDKSALSGSSNWAQLLGSVLESEFPREKFSPSIEFLVGLDAHWNRLPPSKKGGQMPGQDPNKKREVLCVTKIYALPGKATGVKAGSAAPKAKAKPAAEEVEEAAGGEVDALATLIQSIVKAEGTAKKSKIAGLVLKQFSGSPADKNKAVKKASDSAYLESLTELDLDLVWDGDEGTLTYVG